MPNPGAFSGSRKVFLHEQQELYANAVKNGHVADTVADIQRRYFKCYPLNLPHNQEPSQEWLAQVDDDAPEDELVAPDSSEMTHEEWQVAAERYDAQIRDIKARKDVSNLIHMLSSFSQLYLFSKLSDDSITNTPNLAALSRPLKTVH